MGYPVKEYVEDHWYHVYTRGQRGEPLFFSPEDRTQYITLLDKELARRGGNIGSFCLMTNHLHLLLRMGEVPLGEILRVAHSKYAKDFNARRGVMGHVMQGRPKAKVVLDDSYVWRLVGYIHRNPVEANMVEMVTEYEWSSWYWFEDEEWEWLDLESWRYPPGLQGEQRREIFREAVDRGDHEWPGGRTWIGTQEEWDDFQARRKEGREAQAYKERRGIRALQEIAEEMARENGYTVEELTSPDRRRKVSGVRHQIMAMMYNEGHNQADIARFFNRTPRAVRKAIEKNRD